MAKQIIELADKATLDTVNTNTKDTNTVVKSIKTYTDAMNNRGGGQ